MSEFFEIPHFRFEYLTVDTLHTFDLGCSAVANGHAIACLLRSGAFGESGTSGTVLGLKKSLGVFNSKLKKYYRSIPTSELAKTSKIGRLTLKNLNLGKSLNSYAVLHAKGAECRHLVPFVAKLVRRHRHVLEEKGFRGRALHNAFKALQRFYGQLQAQPRDMGEAGSRELTETTLRFMRSCKRARMHLIPKFHMAYHCARQSQASGNPSYYSCFEDESYNRDIGRIIASCHRELFAARVLSKTWLLERQRDSEGMFEQ